MKTLDGQQLMISSGEPFNEGSYAPSTRA